MTEELVVGAIAKLDSTRPGRYIATQNKISPGLPPTDAGKTQFTFGLGPISITGYVEPSSLEVGININVVGISLGNIYGNLNDGVGIKIDILVVQGEVNFYLKNGNELWVHLGLKVVFDGDYKGDYFIIKF